MTTKFEKGSTWLFRVVLLGLTVTTPLCAQRGEEGASGVRYLQGSDVPMLVKYHLAKLGDRIEKPGKERCFLSGVMRDARGDHSVRIALELSGKIRFDSQEDGRAVGFDGRGAWSTRGTPDPADEGILETFLEHSAEAFFYALARGGALRLIGERFHSVDDRGTAQLLDVYELTTPPRLKPGAVLQSKMCAFDSRTRLLRSVRLQEAQRTVEIRLDDWQSVAGTWVPTEWTRKLDGNVVFTFTVTNATFAGLSQDGLFRKP